MERAYKIVPKKIATKEHEKKYTVCNFSLKKDAANTINPIEIKAIEILVPMFNGCLSGFAIDMDSFFIIAQVIF